MCITITAPQLTTFPIVGLNAPEIDYTHYLPALHESAGATLNLEQSEISESKVFALSREHRPEDARLLKGRFAIARAVAREEWGQIKPGTLILFTELYRTPEDAQDESGTTGEFTTHVGPIGICDTQRGVLWAASWYGTGGEDTPNDYELSDVFELHTIERFIEVA